MYSRTIGWRLLGWLHISINHPIILYQLGVFLRHPHSYSFVAIFIAAVVSIEFIWGNICLELFATASRIKSGYLLPFSGCTFKRIQLSDCIDKGHFEVVLSQRHHYVQLRSLGIEPHLDDDLQLYIVRRSENSIVPSTLTAYSTALGATFIFFRDHPDQMPAHARFLLFHEIGHAIGKSAFIGVRQSYFGKALLGGWAWALVMVLPGINLAGLLSILASGVCISLLWVRAYQLKQKSSLQNEHAADEFAVSCLSQGELSRLKEFLQVLEINDALLTAAENAQRMHAIRSLLSPDTQDMPSEAGVEYSQVPIIHAGISLLSIMICGMTAQYSDRTTEMSLSILALSTVAVICLSVLAIWKFSSVGVAIAMAAPVSRNVSADGVQQ